MNVPVGVFSRTCPVAEGEEEAREEKRGLQSNRGKLLLLGIRFLICSHEGNLPEGPAMAFLSSGQLSSWTEEIRQDQFESGM